MTKVVSISSHPERTLVNSGLGLEFAKDFKKSNKAEVVIQAFADPSGVPSG